MTKTSILDVAWFELNTVTSTKILKGIGAGDTPPPPLTNDQVEPWALGKHEKLTLLNTLKIYFQRLFALNFLHLISDGLN